ncbi:MAG: alkaline phosphatase D family protein [Verrucomicrobiota bacterium]|jgi:alkaline phosphatase D|nr:alkaline phosphatase D family protein [Verrucomicrobiota bacterium]
MRPLQFVAAAGTALAVGCATPVETDLAKRPAGGSSHKGPQLIQAGPIIGHVGPAEAKVWVRTKLGSTLTAQANQPGGARNRLSIEDLGNGFSVLRFSRLAPAADTRVKLTVNRAGSAAETAEVAFRTAALPSDTGRVRIAFGSCSKVSQFSSGPIYKAIAEERPDMALFVGDNSYFIVADGSDRHFNTTGPTGDWSSPEAMTARHLTTRMHPDLQSMFRTVPSYAVWDDHDYGPDNADRTFDLREEATEVFRQMWANPRYGTDSIPGIFSSFRNGPVEVFLMDDRYHKYSPQKHKDVSMATGEIWGRAQTDWLLAGLKRSTAPVKVIANGTQVVTRSTGGEGHRREAQNELNRLIEHLDEHRIDGVVFLVGDRHYSELHFETREGYPPLLEFTSSPLQQDQKVEPLKNRPNPYRVWGLRGNSYGLVTVDIPEPGRGTVRFEVRTEANTVPVIGNDRCASAWQLGDLQY